MEQRTPGSDDHGSKEGPDSDAVKRSHDGTNWGKAKAAVLQQVAVSQAFVTLRDMCADAYIDPSCLVVIKRLGEGAFATVDQAWYTPASGASRCIVAVKQLKKELYDNASDMELFVTEVDLMCKLRHRNIVDFIGAGQLSGSSTCAYVVQEFMPGGTLKQLVTRQMLSGRSKVYSNADGLDICLQMARGLRYLHKSSPMVIHRDLKLENVLLKSAQPVKGQQFEVKLADFGLSRRVDVKQAALSVRRQGSNTSGIKTTPSEEMEALWNRRVERSFQSKKPPNLGAGAPQAFALTGRTGSLMYMAPEVYREEPYNEKADVFSFGMMMFEVMQKYIMLSAVAVTGTYKELEEYAGSIAAGYRPPLHKNWPQSISSIITDCWGQDPAKRPSMEEVVARLEAAQAAGDLANLDATETCCSIC